MEPMRDDTSDAQRRETVSIGKSLAGVSAVTSMRDAAHFLCLTTAVKSHPMMVGRHGWGPALLKLSRRTQVLNVSVSDHPFPGAAVRRAKALEQFLDFQRTDHPGRTALATGRCSFLIAWGLSHL